MTLFAPLKNVFDFYLRGSYSLFSVIIWLDARDALLYLFSLRFLAFVLGPMRGISLMCDRK